MSLRSFLADQYLDEDLCPAQDWQSLAALDRASLQSLRLFYGHFAVNLKQYLPSEVRTITYLRSPVGRTVSTIRHMMRDPSFHPLHAQVKGRALRDVIYDDDLLLTFQDAQTKLLSFDVPIEDVLAYVRRQVAAQKFVDIGELEWESGPDKALRALESYDFVGLMDHFKESIWAMCGKFGFAPPDILPELNRATDEQSPPDLTEKDIAHLRSFLTGDIEIYDKIRQNALERLNREKIFADMTQKRILTTLSTLSSWISGAHSWVPVGMSRNSKETDQPGGVARRARPCFISHSDATRSAPYTSNSSKPRASATSRCW
jgi:hypothetical protein